MTKLKGALLLDLDGTVRETKSGAKFINRPEDQQLMVGVEAAIASYAQMGWAIYGVTNQKGVLAGHKSRYQMIAEQLITMDLAGLFEAVFACPDDGESCFLIKRNGEVWLEDGKGFSLSFSGYYRKPSDGMLRQALECHRIKFGPYSKVLMVGDRGEDAAAAQAAGVPFLTAEDWRAGKCPEFR